MESAYNMTGAFNHVSVRLNRGAVEKEVIAAWTRSYGPMAALARDRKDQVSHKYLSEEFKQLTTMATLFPAIFLGVAAFLLNVVSTRLMATQRSQIAILKAFGYTTTAIAIHFLKLTMAIVVIGNLIGIAGGSWMGRGMSNMYMDFYRFPTLEYVLRWHVIVLSVVINAVAASLGTVHAVVRAASEAPAQAMQPAVPGNFRVTLLERLGAARHLSQPTRMIFRNLERRPLKALFSIIGVAMSGGILVMGGFFPDSVDYIVDFQFKQAQRDDLMVVFNDAVSSDALYSLTNVPGITYAEPFRSVAVRLRSGNNTYRTSIQGLEDNGRLRRLLDRSGNPGVIARERTAIDGLSCSCAASPARRHAYRRDNGGTARSLRRSFKRRGKRIYRSIGLYETGCSQPFAARRPLGFGSLPRCGYDLGSRHLREI